MFYGQETVAVGITDGDKRIAVYISGSIDEVLNTLSESFAGRFYVADQVE